MRVVAAPTTPAPAARRPHVTPGPSKTVGATGQNDSVGSVTRRLIGVSVAAVLLLLVVIGLLWRPWQHPQSNTTISSSSNAPTPPAQTATTTAAAPSPAVPPPVTATAAPTTTTPQVDTGPTIGDECFDWMKFSTDSATGQEMICSGYPDDAPKMTWYSTEATLVAGMTDAPRVGKTGSPCSVPPFTFGRSSDGYSVWCLSGQRALMPGRRWLNTPDERPVWALYSP